MGKILSQNLNSSVHRKKNTDGARIVCTSFILKKTPIKTTLYIFMLRKWPNSYDWFMHINVLIVSRLRLQELQAAAQHSGTMSLIWWGWRMLEGQALVHYVLLAIFMDKIWVGQHYTVFFSSNLAPKKNLNTKWYYIYLINSIPIQIL